MAACNIIRDSNNRVLFTEAPNGKRSNLFDALADKFQDTEKALGAWLVSKTNLFKQSIVTPKSLKYRKEKVQALNQMLPTQREITIGDVTIESKTFNSKVTKTANQNTITLLGKDTKGKEVNLGRIRFKESEFEIRVDSSLLSDLPGGIQRRGLGTEMYRQLFIYAMNNNKRVVSSTKLTAGSSGVWNKFLNVGIAEREGEAFVIKNNPIGFDENGEPNPATVLDFIDRNSIESTSTPEDLVAVKEMMLGINVQNSYELLETLKRGFLPEGYFKPTRASLQKTELYSKEEITEILSDEKLQEKIRNFIYKLNMLDSVVENDLYIEDAFYSIKDGSKNEIGKFILENPFEVERRAIKQLGGALSRAEFESKMFEEDLSIQIATPYIERQDTSRDLYYKFRDFKPALEATLEDNQLVPKTDNVRETLEQVLQIPIDGKLSENLDLLANLEEQIWFEAPDSVETLLKTVQEQMIDIGIDATDLVKVSRNKDIAQIKDFLSSVLDFTENQTEQTFDRLYAGYIEFFDINQDLNFENVITSKEVKADNLVYLNTTESDLSLFRDHGLIPVGGKVYKRVLKSKPIEELYDAAYRATTQYGYTNILPDEAMSPTGYDADGTLNLNKIKDPLNRDSIIEDMQNFVRGKIKELYVGNENIPTEDLEKYVLLFNFYNRSSNFLKFKEVPKMSREYKVFSKDINNAEYLQSDFISDFYIRGLKEKLKNSKDYSDFFSKFAITNNGIQLLQQDPLTMERLKLYKDLYKDLFDYMDLHKDGVDIEGVLVTEPIMDDLFMRNYFSNYPTALKPYLNDYTEITENELYTKSKQPFIRTPKGVYEMIKNLGDVSVYGKLQEVPGNFKAYSKTLGLPKISIEEIKLKEIQSNTFIPAEVKNFYTQAESKEIDNQHDNC